MSSHFPSSMFHIHLLFEPSVVFQVVVASAWSPNNLSVVTSEPRHQVFVQSANTREMFSFFFLRPIRATRPKHDCARVKTTGKL